MPQDRERPARDSGAEIHDVIVIGSGASGGMAAWNLAHKGVKVLMLDAGERFDRTKFWTHVQPYDARERNRRGEHAPEFVLDTKEQPYYTPEGKPFDLDRKSTRLNSSHVEI